MTREELIGLIEAKLSDFEKRLLATRKKERERMWHKGAELDAAGRSTAHLAKRWDHLAKKIHQAEYKAKFGTRNNKGWRK